MSLRKFGQRYKGLCPFHSERTASFTLYSESGRYRCFGCGERGDVINLWAHFNDVDTKTAIRQLVAEYGVDSVSELSDRAKRQQSEGFIRKKRDEVRSTLLQTITTLEKGLRSIKTSEELDCYGDLYHVIGQCELWLYNIEYSDTADLDVCMNAYRDICKASESKQL